MGLYKETTRLRVKANVFALHLVSDVYPTCICVHVCIMSLNCSFFNFLATEGQSETGATPGSAPDQQQNETEATPTSGTAETKEGEGEKGKKEKAAEAKKPKSSFKYVDLGIHEKTGSLGKKQMDDLREKEVGCVLRASGRG